MISFENPAALVLCAVPLSVPIIARVFGRRRGRLLAMPLDVWGASPSGDAPGLWRFASRASSVLFALAWILLSIAAAGPASQVEARAFQKTGLDVIFAIDTSPSMAAMDLEPTRLDAAKALVMAYLEAPDGAAGAAVGLVAFGQEAALACPPTTDYKTVADRLGIMSPGMLGDGTAIGQGLASALRQIVSSGAPSAAAVLLSDGEDNAGRVHPRDAAAALGRYGARLYVIGMGSPGEVPIDYVDPATGRRMTGAYRSGYEEGSMARIASAGGGVFRAATDSRALVALLSELGQLGQPEPGRVSLRAPERIPLVRPLFVAAMAMAALAWALRRLALGGLA
jgi:Ca-activated chloride channel family protein